MAGVLPDSCTVIGSSVKLDCMKKRWRPVNNWNGYSVDLPILFGSSTFVTSMPTGTSPSA